MLLQKLNGEGLVPGIDLRACSGITGQARPGAHQVRPCSAGSRSCAPVPGAPLAPWAARPGRQMARRFRDPEITAEDPAVAEHPGNWGCPKFPRKPDVPRKWGQRGWCAAWDRIGSAARARGPRAPAGRARPRTAPARPHAPAAPDRLAGRPPGLRDTICGTRSGWPHRHRRRPFSLSSSASHWLAASSRPSEGACAIRSAPNSVRPTTSRVRTLISPARSTAGELVHRWTARRGAASMSAANEATFRVENTGWMIRRCRRHTPSSAVNSPSPSIIRSGR
jgi:hypothetical protein